jgi:hypothetical protein
MGGADDIMRRVARLKRTAKRAVEEAWAQSRASAGGQRGEVNIARRGNIVLAVNSDEPGSLEVASARQVVEIDQRGARDAGERRGR